MLRPLIVSDKKTILRIHCDLLHFPNFLNRYIYAQEFYTPHLLFEQQIDDYNLSGYVFKNVELPIRFY